MTCLTIIRDGNGLRGFEAQGHAGFAEHGQDIVCSAVSALTQATWLGLEQVACARVAAEADETAGHMRVLIGEEPGSKPYEAAQVLLETLRLAVTALGRAYPGHVSLKVRRCNDD